MAELAQALPQRIRDIAGVDASDALEVTRPSGAAVASILPRRDVGRDAVREPQLLGVRLGSDSQVSAWATLPGDSMGSVLDETSLPGQIAELLRLIGRLRVVQSPRIAIGVGVNPTTMLSLGRLAQLPRTSMTVIQSPDQPTHVLPDELMTLSALDAGSTEVGRVLTRSLLEWLTARR